MRKYDFDKIVDRRGSDCMKYDACGEVFGREDVMPMWIADMDFEVCPAITEALANRVAHRVYGYGSEPAGYWESIISWLNRRHGLKVDRRELAFVAGIVRGLGYAINYFTRPGDKVLIQPPVYHPFRNVTEGNGRVVVENPLVEREDGGFEMDLEGLARVMAQERPRLMVLCNPHNPIGLQWDERVLARVGELARKYDVVVVSDEIHGDLMLGGRRHLPFCAVSEDCAAVSVVFGAPSKTFNIPGLTSSWMIVKNAEMRKGFYHWMEVNEFSCPQMLAMTATKAAYTEGEEWLDKLLEYVEGNIEAADRFCREEMPMVKVVKPEASFLVWLDFRSLGLEQAELERLMIEKAGVGMNSGTMFGTEGGGFMRMNVAMPREVMLKGLCLIRDAVKG